MATQAETFYEALKAAYLALCSGVEEYTYNAGGSSRTFRRADITVIRKEMEYWEGRVSREAGNSQRTRYFLPVDDEATGRF